MNNEQDIIDYLEHFIKEEHINIEKLLENDDDI